MYTYSKDGVTTSAMLDTRKINANGKYPVKIRVNYKRVRNYYPTSKELTISEWDNLRSIKTRVFKEIREDIESSFYLIKGNVDSLIEKGEFSFDTLNTRLGKGIGGTVNDALAIKIDLLLSEDRIGTMQLHQETLRLVTEFAGDKISFDAINVSWLKRCEAYWLKTKNHTSIGMHLRNIRAIMNEAKRAGVIKDSQYPFGRDKYEIKTGEAQKRALSINQIAQIFHYSDGNETTDRYRDLWIFIYMCNGINVVDLVRLKYSDIADDEISFIRQKTERTSKNIKKIKAPVTPEMQAIIKRWGNPPKRDNYIFPYLKGNETALERKAIAKDLTKRINKRIKNIGEAIGIGRNITTYVARHSFATVLKRSGANIAYISESLGHSDLKTTEHYLADFEKGEREKNAALLTNFS